MTTGPKWPPPHDWQPTLEEFEAITERLKPGSVAAIEARRSAEPSPPAVATGEGAEPTNLSSYIPARLPGMSQAEYLAAWNARLDAEAGLHTPNRKAMAQTTKRHKLVVDPGSPRRQLSAADVKRIIESVGHAGTMKVSATRLRIALNRALVGYYYDDLLHRQQSDTAVFDQAQRIHRHAEALANALQDAAGNTLLNERLRRADLRPPRGRPRQRSAEEAEEAVSLSEVLHRVLGDAERLARNAKAVMRTIPKRRSKGRTRWVDVEPTTALGEPPSPQVLLVGRTLPEIFQKHFGVDYGTTVTKSVSKDRDAEIQYTTNGMAFTAECLKVFSSHCSVTVFSAATIHKYWNLMRQSREIQGPRR